MTPQEHDALLKVIDRALVAVETDPNLDDIDRDARRVRLLTSQMDLPSFPESALSVIHHSFTAKQMLAPSTADQNPLTRPVTKRRAGLNGATAAPAAALNFLQTAESDHASDDASMMRGNFAAAGAGS